MADIFLSYARSDRERAERLAKALEGQGWSVFRDLTIPPGYSWDAHIGGELEKARCVVVAWSKAAVKSKWIHEEAGLAHHGGVLISVLLDPVKPPLGFRTLPSVDLSEWDGRADAPGFQQLAADVERLLASEPQEDSTTRPPRKSRSEPSQPDTSPQAIEELMSELGRLRDRLAESEQKRRETLKLLREQRARGESARAIFVCYRRKDSDIAATVIVNALARLFGEEKVFFDVDAIPVAAEFRDALSSQLAGCALFACIIGPHWLSMKDRAGRRRLDLPDDPVRFEIAAALDRDIPVVPILLSGTPMPESRDLPEDIRRLAGFQAQEVRAGRDLQRDVDKLAGKLKDLIPED